VFAVRYGTRTTTRGEVFVDDHDPSGEIAMDYFFWLLRGEHDILVDTGTEPARAERMGRKCLWPPRAAYEELGIRPHMIVLTHLHHDHTGNLVDGVDIIAPGLELDTPMPPFDAIEVESVRRVARRIDSSGEIAPGVYAHLIGGHSPGQMVLELDQLVIASDAVHYYEELEGGSVFSIYHDLQAMLAGYELLRTLGKPIVAGHDPAVLERFEARGNVIVCG